MSIALFDCPHCIDEFAFDYQKIAKLTDGWRVRVRCPGCGNVVEVVMLVYTLIHNCDPGKYKPAEIVEILPPDPNLSPEWWMAARNLRMEVCRKKSGWATTKLAFECRLRLCGIYVGECIQALGLQNYVE